MYQSDDLSGPLTLGTLGSRALVFQTYQLANTPGLLTTLYGSSVDSADLEAAGYVDLDEDGHVWAPSGTQTLDPDHFYAALSVTDPFGNTSNVSWDSSFYLPTSVEDPLGNTVSVEIDPVSLQPIQITDPNGNRTFAAYDPLGRPIAVSVQGKEGDSDGDTLGDPTVSFSYNLTDLPASSTTLSRTEHGGSEFLTRVSYSDGGGNLVQEKVTAASGWLGSGRTVLNNKGLPVKQYEPFFSATEAYEFEDEVVATGVSSTIFYDPVGRATRVELPNGTLRRVSFTPWRQTHEDENDAVLETTWYSTRHALDLSDPERQAAEKAAAHADTPTTVHLDALGRPYQTDEIPEEGLLFSTILTLDILGNPTTVTGARSNPTQTQVFDPLGRPLKTISPDVGETLVLLDIAGQPVTIWKTGELRLDQAYDALRRPTTKTVTTGSDPATIREIIEYGEVSRARRCPTCAADRSNSGTRPGVSRSPATTSKRCGASAVIGRRTTNLRA